MQLRVFSRLSVLLHCALLLGLMVAPAAAQVRIVTPEKPVAASELTLDGVFRHGGQLEREHRWGDALTYYEEALHDFPQQRVLRQRFELAKLHYDLGRRYSDRSFRAGVDYMSQDDALEIYTEVLLKIQTHHVNSPNWKRLVEWGTSSLEVALTDPDFQARHLPNQSVETIDAYRGRLRARVRALSIDTRQAARAAVAAIGRMTSNELGVPASATVMEYTCGATNSLDDYSAYLTADQLRDVYSQIDGNFVGLGVELKSSEGSLLIVNIISGSPAQRSGMRAGDRIVAVDGRTTNELSTDEAASMLQGEEGSLVELTILSSNDQQRRVSIRRSHVEVPSIDDVHMLDAENTIGYFKMTCFQKTTTRDLDKALWQLSRQGMRTLVMDLRGNPGGLLTCSVEISDRFVESGTIVSTRGRNPHEDFNYSAHGSGTWDIPLIVLIDGDSASASEIFAGAIREHRRGTIIGTRSYGKGSVQGIFPLAPTRGLPGAGLRLTTAKFYSPSGRAYSKVGVEPDVVVHQTARPVGDQFVASSSEEDDPFISAAINVARENLARR